jgi:colanic acid/amylovoran biosynthesis glycosyltransferase
MSVVQRIAYVLKAFPQLTQTFILGELRELRRRSIEVLILSLGSPPETLRHKSVAEAGLDRVTIYDPAQFLPRLIEFRPQLLHAHFATRATAAARSLAKEIGVPFTFTAHGYDIYFAPPKDFYERAVAAAAVVTVSEANRDHITNSFSVPPEYIHVIPNGVDTDFFSPAVDPRRGAGQPPLMVCVARHEPVKNLRLLLETCAVLRDREIEFRCVMVGDGAERSDLEAIRRGLNLDHFVEMVGELERGEVRDWWRRADLAVLSSDSEGMPVSLIEAAACGVPAVATRVGGIPELIGDGVTGVLTAPRDPSALANALARMLADPQRAFEMGQAARRRVIDRFSLRLQLDGLIALWEDVVKQSARTG